MKCCCVIRLADSREVMLTDAVTSSKCVCEREICQYVFCTSRGVCCGFVSTASAARTQIAFMGVHVFMTCARVCVCMCVCCWERDRENESDTLFLYSKVHFLCSSSQQSTSQNRTPPAAVSNPKGSTVISRPVGSEQ